MPHMIVLEKGRAAGLALRTLLVHKEAEGLGLGKVAKTLPSVCRGEIKIQNVCSGSSRSIGLADFGRSHLHIPSDPTILS